MKEGNYMNLGRYAFVLICAAGALLRFESAGAEEARIISQWLYSSYSFGADAEDDTVIGGMRLYGGDDLIVQDNAQECGYTAPSVRGDSAFMRAQRDKRPCVAIMRHYCPLRPEGKQTVEGYLYFDAGPGFGINDRELTFEIEYFDDRNKPLKLRYVNSENSLATADILCEGTGRWRTARINVSDAYFNMEGHTVLGDGSCDFRIEANGAMALIGKVALYNYADSQSGRSYKSIAIDGKRTERTYFTQSMWTPDSKKLLLRSSEGWIYAYDVANDSVQKLVKCSADFYVSRGNYLYYVDTAAKTINRLSLGNNEEEILTSYPPGAYTAPNYIHVNNADTRLSVMFSEDASPLDREVGEGGTAERRNRRIPVYEIDKGKWDLRYTHEFPAGTPHMTHLMINPVYDKLVFFCHEGTTTKIPDRMRCV